MVSSEQIPLRTRRIWYGWPGTTCPTTRDGNGSGSGSGELTVHYALAALITRAAEAADLDRIRFTRSLRIARRTVTGTAGIPLGPD